MALDLLLEQFDGLIQSPADVKKLEQTILQWAVMGRLVPQNPNDEPASVLLERITAEKARLVKEKKIRKGKKLPPISEEKLPYEAATGWVWHRLGEMARFIDYRGKTPKKTENGIPLITAKNVKYGYFSVEPREYVSADIYDGWMTRGIPRKGDVLFTTEAPLGNVTLLETDSKVVFAQRLITLQFYAEISGLYIKYVLMSHPIRKVIYSKATGTTAKGIKASRLKLIPIPLPPLEEQKRIVARVDELFALCDELAAALESAEVMRGRFLDAVLAQTVSIDSNSNNAKPPVDNDKQPA